MPRLLCASPGYIEQQEKPESPAELAKHECIIFTRLPTPHHWTFNRNKGTGSLKNIDKDTIEQEWMMYLDGKPVDSTTFKQQRVEPL